METFWEAADDPNETIDKLAEIVNYINSHEELDLVNRLTTIENNLNWSQF
jgi:hypothetical protein